MKTIIICASILNCQKNELRRIGMSAIMMNAANIMSSMCPFSSMQSSPHESLGKVALCVRHLHLPSGKLFSAADRGFHSLCLRLPCCNEEEINHYLAYSEKEEHVKEVNSPEY